MSGESKKEPRKRKNWEKSSVIQGGHAVRGKSSGHAEAWGKVRWTSNSIASPVMEAGRGGREK